MTDNINISTSRSADEQRHEERVPGNPQTEVSHV